MDEVLDISNEKFRFYEFVRGRIVIDRPMKLNITSSGNHEITDLNGHQHLIPLGWKNIIWQSIPN